jgi:uncharacterized protein (AIM24 family)
MISLIAKALAWIARRLGLLLIIVGILVAVAWLKSERDSFEHDRQVIVDQQTLLESLQAELKTLHAKSEAAKPYWTQAQKQFEAVKKSAADIRAAANGLKAEVAALERASRWWDKYVDPAKWAELELKKKSYGAWARAATQAERAQAKAARVLRDSPIPGGIEARNKKELEIEALDDRIHDQRERLAQKPAERLLAAIKANLPAAILILLGILITPIVIKAFLFFVLAPAASRLSPIRILPNPHAPPLPEPRSSAVSVSIDVGADEELLVQANFLQSSSRPARKHTVWLLNWQIPFSSVASGMFALTSIRPEGAVPTRVVVSAQDDAFGEVGIIEIPNGAAMVIQPRALAGIVKPAGPSVAITRHWRLLSLHAWLTLQFRYLVFHGPCKVILKGCRGVRTEEPQADQARLINQAATLGFSANLDYRTTRCETFVSYLRGQEDLFNDLFGGGPGRFVYEEIPAMGRRAGVAGGGLEGVLDAFLKAFGI